MKAAALLLLAACTTSAATRAPDADRQPSFSRDVAPVLEKHCAASKGCHGANPTEHADLDLRLASAYAQLVGHAADMRPGAVRVIAGDPDHSFVVDKLLDRLSGHDGKRMPIDPDTGAPMDPSPLPADYVDHVLIPWIAAGAPNN
jgi:hypothetical protein